VEDLIGSGLGVFPLKLGVDRRSSGGLGVFSLKLGVDRRSSGGLGIRSISSIE